jgi:hypothetical protein
LAVVQVCTAVRGLIEKRRFISGIYFWGRGALHSRRGRRSRGEGMLHEKRGVSGAGRKGGVFCKRSHPGHVVCSKTDREDPAWRNERPAQSKLSYH